MWETISKKTKNWNNIKAIILNNFDSYSISKDFKFELEQLPSKKNFN
ncbi:hypothetical protein GL981_11840 (plasmid) [Spiroplasma citri]|nr:hypothetical protein GL981_11840 [Spiroplasma citri]